MNNNIKNQVTNKKMNEILSKNGNFTNANFSNFDQYLFQNKEHLRDELFKKNLKFKKAYENYENKLLKELNENKSNNNWNLENLQRQLNNENNKRNNNVNTSFAPNLLKNQLNILSRPLGQNNISNANLKAELNALVLEENLNALNLEQDGGKRKRKTKSKKKKKRVTRKKVTRKKKTKTRGLKGRKVHKGPRGGKYVIVNGKKKYL